MKRSPLTRKPAKVKQPSLNHPERPFSPPVRPVARSQTKKRARVPKVSPTRQKANRELAAHIARFPEFSVDPLTGARFPTRDGEFHHPAGRRKASYLFVVALLPSTHRWVHANPKDAEAVGLLWPGRNSKTFTAGDADALAESIPHPFSFQHAIMLWETPLQPQETPQDHE